MTSMNDIMFQILLERVSNKITFDKNFHVKLETCHFVPTFIRTNCRLKPQLFLGSSLVGTCIGDGIVPMKIGAQSSD